MRGFSNPRKQVQTTMRFNLLRDWILSPAPLAWLGYPCEVFDSFDLFSYLRVATQCARSLEVSWDRWVPFTYMKAIFYDGVGFDPTISGFHRPFKCISQFTLWVRRCGHSIIVATIVTRLYRHGQDAPCLERPRLRFYCFAINLLYEDLIFSRHYTFYSFAKVE